MKTYVIAGGTSGVAKHLVEALVKLGHSVVFGDIGQDSLADKIISKLKLHSGKAIFVPTDVTKVEDCERLFRIAYDQFTRIDGFFSYAGVTPAQSIEECTEDVYNQIFDVNVKGAIFCCKQAIKYMKMGRGGSIILTGSPHSDAGEIDRVSYACSKGAIVTLANHIAKNYGNYNIRSNYITLGWTPTEGELALRKSQGMSESDLRNYASKFIPMGRMNDINDIIPAILYLLSDDSKMVSGSNIRITGGWYM